MATINVMGIACPIYIKKNSIIVKGTNREYILFQHDYTPYLQYKYDSYLTLGLTIREQALIAFSDK